MLAGLAEALWRYLAVRSACGVLSVPFASELTSVGLLPRGAPPSAALDAEPGVVTDWEVLAKGVPFNLQECINTSANLYLTFF